MAKGNKKGKITEHIMNEKGKKGYRRKRRTHDNNVKDMAKWNKKRTRKYMNTE